MTSQTVDREQLVDGIEHEVQEMMLLSFVLQRAWMSNDRWMQ